MRTGDLVSARTGTYRHGKNQGRVGTVVRRMMLTGVNYAEIAWDHEGDHTFENPKDLLIVLTAAEIMAEVAAEAAYERRCV